MSLLSGRFPFETDVRDDVGHIVPESVPLVSSMLADRGYATAGVVSSFALRENTGLARGFTVFDDTGRGQLGGSDPRANPSAQRVAPHASDSEKRVERCLSAVGTTRAFVFLQVSANVAGVRHMDADPFAPIDPEDAEVAHADQLIGRLVAYLKKQQLYEHATVIVTAAHGEGAGSHGQYGADLSAFDRVVHVPLVIKQAGNVAGSDGAGRRVSQLAQHVDIVPTILDFAKAPLPAGLAGRSLRPLLDGRELNGQLAYAESLFPALHYGLAPVQMVTDGRYQLVKGATSALFDLNVELQNRTDLSDWQTEVVTRLTKALDEWTSDTELPTVTRASTLSLDERDAWLGLGSLGPLSVAGDPRHPVKPSAMTSDSEDVKPDVVLVEGFAAAMREVANRRWATAIERLRA